MVTSNVNTAVRVNHNVERRAESLADHFAIEDRLEAKSNAHAAELLERARARLERIATDPNPAKATDIEDRQELIKKRATAPSEGPDAWTQRDFESLLEVSVLHEPWRLAQRCCVRVCVCVCVRACVRACGHAIAIPRLRSERSGPTVQGANVTRVLLRGVTDTIMFLPALYLHRTCNAGTAAHLNPD